MNESFVYVTYIRTTPENLWNALTHREFNKKFWFGMHQECDWKKGAPWKLVFSDGRVADAGEVLEIEPPKSLVLRWRNEFDPELNSEGYTQCRMTIEPEEGRVKLTVRHEGEKPGHKLIPKVSNGWAQVLSSLKSLLETGEALPRTEAAKG